MEKYQLPEIYDFNNDPYEVIIENLPSFIIYDQQNYQIQYDISQINNHIAGIYTIDIIL